ncbi:M15 family metallopeptidase [Globicatella sanguinis]|uniref:M15 family metallopeptidase n=1 Tax=Globicatella sanguinis TaxID=13076 RepID=UPI002542E9CA|nr:M15 family metallopeptidase [Globicatella sanguinis]MDK7631056.1 M15 family metallopeptidase [Globicatella sanguinis]WIK65463.1 M15 family metallopeptidase [Globicatella sanguinis]WKT54868.1 M15 family metallopeptidase [Globicatella sanguinis]
MKNKIFTLFLLLLSILCVSNIQAQTETTYQLPDVEAIRPSDDSITIDQLIKELPETASIDNPLLFLVNRDNLLEYDPYIPFVYSENGQPYHEAMAAPLAEMRAAAAEAGYYYNFISGYRSIAEQAFNYESRFNSYLYEGYSEADAQYMTDQYVAPSNGSEHTTGLAVDLLGAEFGYELYVSYQYEPSAQWLAENAHHYGFILRYLEGKTDITKINFEPWHFRYVGVEHAEFIHKHGLVLEEYIALIQERDSRQKLDQN